MNRNAFNGEPMNRAKRKVDLTAYSRVLHLLQVREYGGNALLNVIAQSSLQGLPPNIRSEMLVRTAIWRGRLFNKLCDIQDGQRRERGYLYGQKLQLVSRQNARR